MAAHFCTAHPCPLCYPNSAAWPWQVPQVPAFTAGGTRPSLSDFTDEEIAREYHWRAMRKLGDQRISVGFTCAPSIGG